MIKKRWMRFLSICMAFTMIMGSAVNVVAAAPEEPVDAVTSGNASGDKDEPESAPTMGTTSPDTPAQSPSGKDPLDEQENISNPGVSSDQETPSGSGESSGQETPGSQGTDNTPPASDKQPDKPTPVPEEPNTEKQETEQKDISGKITVDEDVSGKITVEEDKNDDQVEIKKSDKPYLALGADLSAEQQATVLGLMGIDGSKLADYNVVYVNNSEEHQYLDSYIDSSKIGSRSLSSIVIVERGDGNGINISTNNISYCTVGMYKNALATAGIANADIIVAAPFAISGTAALVGVFKAYEQMTGDTIDEENIDAALHELVVTGSLEASGGSADEVEGMIAYVKQAVVEHDLSDETEIRKVLAEACDKFDITLNEEEIGEVVKLMQKISDLDLDLDKLLNSAQSIYDKIMNADSGFWAKLKELLMTIINKIKELF